MLKIFSCIEHSAIAIIFSHLEYQKINRDKNDINDCKESIHTLLMPLFIMLIYRGRLKLRL